MSGEAGRAGQLRAGRQEGEWALRSLGRRAERPAVSGTELRCCCGLGVKGGLLGQVSLVFCLGSGSRCSLGLLGDWWTPWGTPGKGERPAYRLRATILG